MRKIFLLLTVVTIFAFSSTVVFASSSYSDVGLNDKYSVAIEYISEEGVVSGYPDGSFKSDELMNRAELSKILSNAFFSVPGGIDSYDDDCFDDVKSGEWYTPYICFLKTNKIVSGHPDGTFRPADKVNLVEALKMILKIYKIEYGESTPWYQGIVEKASLGNFISLDFTSFDQKVSRGQMADITTRVMKYMQYNVDKDYSALNNYLGFLKDYKVTYDSLNEGENIEKEARDISKVHDATVVQFEVMTDSSNHQIAVYSSDAIENETLGCSQGYFSGNFKMSILSTDQSGGRDKILNEVDLGYRTLFPVGATHFVNMNYGEIALDPLIILEEYGNCNGNMFTFFRPKNYYENFVEIEFDNLEENKIYATSFEDFEFDLEAFNYQYYDNSTGKLVTKYYSWDENLGTFILDEDATTEEDYPENPAKEQSLEEMGYIDLGHLFSNVVISGFKITDFDSFLNPGEMWDENDLTVSFKGEKNLTGEYKWNVLYNDFCFYPNSEYAQQLPRLKNDDREVYICFSNSSEVNDLFDSTNIAPGDSVEAEIRIDSYTYNYAKAGYSYANTAKLLEILEFK